MSRIVWAAALLALLSLSGCGSDGKGGAAVASETKIDAIPPVKSFVVGARAGGQQLLLPGELRAAEEAPLAFRVAGKILHRAVDVGQTVRRGQALAQLDNQDYLLANGTQRASVDAAAADAELARAELSRVTRLHAQGYISAAQVERQQAAYDAATARVKALSAQLDQTANQARYTTLSADTDGVITAVLAEPGQVVQAGQPVLRLARRGALEAVVQVPETRLAEFTPTAEFRVSVNALGDAEYHARLVEFSPQADAATRTYTAKLGLEAKPELRLGMSVRVAPTSPVAGNALLIPAAALYSRSNQAQVWVIDAKTSTVRLVPVLTAGLRGEHVLVRQGLQPGDRIVAAGGNLLNAGQRVRPVEIKS